MCFSAGDVSPKPVLQVLLVSWQGVEKVPGCSLRREGQSLCLIVELRTPATPVGVGGGKERGGCHLNLRT